MPRAPIRATLDVRPRCEINSNLHKQAGTGAPRNIARIRIALTNIALKSTMTNTGQTTRERETTSVHRKEGIESSSQRVLRKCWTN